MSNKTIVLNAIDFITIHTLRAGLNDLYIYKELMNKHYVLQSTIGSNHHIYRIPWLVESIEDISCSIVEIKGDE